MLPPTPHDSGQSRDSRFLAGLTASQAEAARVINGPLLILAGPGSGKTRTVTHRIAHLLDSGIPQRAILAITFTNKAANEMRDRVTQLVPECFVVATTFHKFCAKILRQHAAVAGLGSNYTILDTPDQRRLMKDVLSELDIDGTHYPPARVLTHISNAKNRLVTPDQFTTNFDASVGDHFQAVVTKAYPKYQSALLASNAVDFDDLLMHVAIMLSEQEGLREQLSNRFQYILVDEYQDTNDAQYRTIAALASSHRNLCVTGDPDQSIYGWRGARIENILNFERDFTDTKVVRLEQNFRSTQAILQTADSLIEHNLRRKAKSLTTDNSSGEAVRMIKFDDGVAEAEYIAESIRAAVEDTKTRFDDFAVFYRVNSLSRELERALTRAKVPYRVAQGTAFYDRAEVKDVLAYLRLLANPDDRTAFQRIINKPARRLGQTSQNRLEQWASSNGVTLFEAARQALACESLRKPARGGFRAFAETLDSINETTVKHDGRGIVATIVRAVVQRTGYLLAYEKSTTGAAGGETWTDEKAAEIVANVEEIVTAAADYDRRLGDDATLNGFLEESALVSDTDALEDDTINDDASSQGAVTLMTLHAAKGLEFPRVYLIGVEQGLLPHERSLRENTLDDLEEERRLLFVGITRAEQQLTLTHTAARALRGRTQISIQSQFLPELAVDHHAFTTRLAGSAEYRAQRSGQRWSATDADNDWGMPSRDVHADFPTTADDSDTSHNDGEQSAGSEQNETKVSIGQPAMGQAKRKLEIPGLTTGAELLKGSNSPVDVMARYDIGQQVRHPHYGVGMVVSIGEVNRRTKVAVEFGDTQETFIVGLAPLEIIN